MLVRPEDYIDGILKLSDAIPMNVGRGKNDLLIDVINREVPEILKYILGEEQYQEYKASQKEIHEYEQKRSVEINYTFPEHSDQGKTLEDWYQLFWGIGRVKEAVMYLVYAFYLAESEIKQGAVGFGRSESDSFSVVSPRRNYVDAFNRYARIMQTHTSEFLTRNKSFENYGYWWDNWYYEYHPLIKNYFDL